MKKIILILIVIVVTISCSNDESSLIISGTEWEKIIERDSQNSGLLRFTNETEFILFENELPVIGTYTFNGKTGVLTLTNTDITIAYEIDGQTLSMIAYTDTSEIISNYKKL